MEPTLMVGDYVLVTKFSYFLRSPSYLPFTDIPVARLSFPGYREVRRNDVVIFWRSPNSTMHQSYVKRCVALPGDTVTDFKGSIAVNSLIIDSSGALVFLYEKSTPLNKVIVEPGHYYMMGDNRLMSFDSRHWGCIADSEVIGQAVLILWSWSPDIPLADFWNKLRSIRWDRIGKIIE